MAQMEFFLPLIEIAIIAIMLNYLLSFFWNTRAMDLIFGFLAFLLLFLIATWLRLPVLQKIMFNVVNVVVLAIFIIFQPEIRMALSRLSLKGKKYQYNDPERLIDILSTSVYHFSQKHIGAIIAVENSDLLDEYGKNAVPLNATLSNELLESIFETTAPLHDGGVLIRGFTITYGAVIFPLADDSTQLTRSMGTRHRAALGLSQQTDAIVIVVSEENGMVSIAREGILTKSLKVDRFKAILRTLLLPNKQSHFSWNKK